MRIANDILILELGRLLKEGKEVRFTPSGVSMRPFIEGDQDSVILEAVTASPRKGDVLLASVLTQAGTQTYVLHRLVRIEKGMQGEAVYVLQGDGNISGEERCGYADIIGRVIRIEAPSGRRKPMVRGRVWYAVRRWRPFLLKVYRHSILKWCY